MTSPHNRLEDLHVARAAAKIPGQSVTDFAVTRIWNSFEQIHRSHNHSGRTDAALCAAMFDECLLHGVQLSLTRRKSFDSHDRRARDLCDRHETAVDDLSVDRHRARAAFTFAASLFCSG